MKLKYILVSSLLLAFVFSMAQDKGSLVFDNTVCNYGTLKYGEYAECEFNFTNNGKSDLLINSVKSNSRSLTFKLTDSLILKNQKGKLIVIYDTNDEGPIRKTITIFSDGEPSVYTLSLKGRVLPKP
ncbi:DUF1573 domain-containing protein [Flavobacteriaceae bacterium 14752]|uniref:DUF1573 domain-containing protein n=1 Tax=Mesohalobacter salilacus TaxID=2491711 RepID=UPI000F630216|nr:DUF1573 domain-containing protein [Flavobacteriaceae bacterium 14752]